ncbi:MAG: YqhA family protein [Chloroflexi bacterium]|nr:YqhA family protein [Chloroflexota bacterium]
MKKWVEKSKYLILIAVVSSLVASTVAFLWGAVKTVKVLVGIVTAFGADPTATVALVELMDTFLIATVLFIFGIGMYELFIGRISLPEWLIIRNLHDLKVKLSSVIILVMGIVFLEHLVEWSNPQGTLFFGIAMAIVSAALIAFGYFGGKSD